MSPHIEVLEAAATFGDDSVGLLSFICSAIPQIVRSRTCPCLWCKGVEDNPLIIFDDLQDRMLDSWSTNVSVCSSESRELSPDITVDTPLPLPVWDPVMPLTSERIEAIERQRRSQPLNMHSSFVGINTNTFDQSIRQSPSLIQPQPQLRAINRPRKKSAQIDQRAILAAEVQKRAEKRAHGQMDP